MSTENTEESGEVTPNPAEGGESGEAGEQHPWGEDFEPEKAWKLVQNLREDNKKLSKREVLTDDARTKLSEYDALVAASKTDIERMTDALAVEKARAEALRTTAVASKVEALAAKKFADPSDAIAFLDPTKYVSDSGSIDADAISADLADLLGRKPHLGRTEVGEPKPFPGQGASASGAPKGQWTEADLDKASAEKRYADIEKARVEGRLDSLMGAKK